MVFAIYPLPLFASIVLLALWTHFHRQNLWSTLWRNLFFAGLGSYFISLVLAHGNLETKLNFLFRDMMILAIVGAIFQLFLRSTGAFVTGLLFMLGGLTYLYQSNLMYFSLQAPFESDTVDQVSLLDQDGEILIELKEGVLPSAILPLLGNFQVEVKRAFQPKYAETTELDDYYLVDVKSNDLQEIKSIETLLAENSNIDWLEENEIIFVDLETTNKAPISDIKQRFGVNDPGLEFLWGFDALRVDKLYEFLRTNQIKPSKKTVIAILDTGVDAEHEDIKSNFTSINKAYDTDKQGHGTHCAGIAGSVSNNGVGVASFGPENQFYQISSVKVLSDNGMGTQARIINGIIEAADQGVDVISMSLGGLSNQSKQTAYEKAVQYANDKGAIVVVAAGNSRMDSKNYSPANVKGVIAVTAVNDQLRKADFSNFVRNIEMGVAAPGVGIYSTIPQDKYATYNGTSMATPYVSGLIGLMKSIEPAITTKQVFQILNRTGKTTFETNDTGRFIQPYDAVKMLVQSK